MSEPIDQKARTAKTFEEWLESEPDVKWTSQHFVLERMLAAWQASRLATLEEAAGIADKESQRQEALSNDYLSEGDTYEAGAGVARTIAAAIRGLAQKGEGTDVGL